MDRDWDDSLKADMLKFLEQTRLMNDKWKKKEEAKLWAAVQVPLGIEEALSRLTKDQLSNIRRNLAITGISNLKKAELISKLKEYIPVIAHESFQCFDHDRYQLVRKIMKNGGWVSASSLEIEKVEYLRDYGLFFPGLYEKQQVLIMPVELIKTFSRMDEVEYQKMVQRNTEWIKLTHGLLYYYGTLGFNTLKNMVEKYSGDKIDTYQYMQVIRAARGYYREIRMDSAGHSNYRVFNSRQVIAEHQARPNLNYYGFSKKQLMTAGEPGFMDRNEAYMKFVKFIVKDYTINYEEADQIVEECVYAIRIEHKPADILQYLQSLLEIEDIETLQAFMEHITSLMNNTRQWVLKGHCPNELWEQEKQFLKPLPSARADIINIKTRQKVGRNDPCPCGSGKKYKKCCGRVN